MFLSQENTASPSAVGKETGDALDEPKPQHSHPSSVPSCHFSADAVMLGGRRAHLFPFLYLPKPGVARIQRMSSGKGILPRGFLLHEDAQENITNVILVMF